MKIREGYMPFEGHQTYYRIVGENEPGKKTLVLLHGGPGSTHNYFEVLDDLAKSGRQLVMYDQIGCGKSFISGRDELFTAQTWIRELEALRAYLGLEEIHLLGQSWGGMQAIIYALDYKAKGICSYILSSTLASAKLWEEEQRRRISYMDQKDQKALFEAVESKNYSGGAYGHALDKFMALYCAGEITDKSPECIKREKISGRASYIQAWGENEFSPTGNLASYEYRDRLHEIKEACLITSGGVDLCSPFIAKDMYDRLPNASWELFQYSRHMPFVEEREKYMRVLGQWLNDHDV